MGGEGAEQRTSLRKLLVIPKPTRKQQSLAKIDGGQVGLAEILSSGLLLDGGGVTSQYVQDPLEFLVSA